MTLNLLYRLFMKSVVTQFINNRYNKCLWTVCAIMGRQIPHCIRFGRLHVRFPTEVRLFFSPPRHRHPASYSTDSGDGRVESYPHNPSGLRLRMHKSLYLLGLILTSRVMRLKRFLTEPCGCEKYISFKSFCRQFQGWVIYLPQLLWPTNSVNTDTVTGQLRHRLLNFRFQVRDLDFPSFTFSRQDVLERHHPSSIIITCVRLQQSPACFWGHVSSDFPQNPHAPTETAATTNSTQHLSSFHFTLHNFCSVVSYLPLSRPVSRLGQSSRYGETLRAGASRISVRDKSYFAILRLFVREGEGTTPVTICQSTRRNDLEYFSLK